MSGNRLKHKQLAAAITLALLGSVPAAPVWAADDGTTTGTAIYAGELGQVQTKAFTAFDAANPKNTLSGSSWKKSTTIGLNNYASQNNDGYTLALGEYSNPVDSLAIGTSYGNWNEIMQHGHDKYGGTYEQIVCVLPDGSQVAVNITQTNVTKEESFNAIMEAVNAYATQPEVAKAVMEAYYKAKEGDGDKAAIAQILPKFYYADADGNYDTSALVPIASIGFKALDVQQTGANSRPPSNDKGTKSYADKTVTAGSKWRPLDRCETYGEGGYITGGQWAIRQYYQLRQVSGDSWQLSENSVSDSKYPAFGDNAKSEHIVNTDGSVITVGKLQVDSGGIVDLSYANTTGVDPVYGRPIVSYLQNWLGEPDSTHTSSTVYYPTGYYAEKYVDGVLTQVSVKRTPQRYLYADHAVLADGAVFRVGSYGVDGSSKFDNANAAVWNIAAGKQDQVYIKEAEQAEKNNGTTKLYVQLGWVPGVGQEAQGSAVNVTQYGTTKDTVVVGILNGSENFEVEGQKSLSDGIFSYYEITPVIGKWENYFNTSGAMTEAGNPAHETGTAWYLKSYTYKNTAMTGESGRTAAENFTVTNNLWKSNYTNLFRQIGGVHRGGLPTEQTAAKAAAQQNLDSMPSLEAEDLRETVWSEAWHGKYNSAAGYGRSVSQSYNGMQVGYDKLLGKPYFGGKMYVGAYLMKLDGKSHTATGSGEQDSIGGGIYSSWVGAKGHFLDAALLAARLENEYKFQGPTTIGQTSTIKGDSAAWAYGLGAQYGYKGQLGSGWFYEPSVSMFAGHTDKTQYVLSNGLGISQGGTDNLMGRVGLRFGKMVGSDGSLYGGVAAAREFAGGASLGQFMSGMSQRLQTANGKDSWYELSLGGNIKISPTGVFDLSYNRTLGSDIGNEWNINGMLKWSWGAAGGKHALKTGQAETEPAAVRSFAKADAPVVVVGQQAVAGVKVPQLQAPAVTAGKDIAADRHAEAVTADTAADQVVFDTSAASGTVTDDGMGEFELGAVTVEGKRPDWEKSLSPGQVSVVYPSQFEGEQKDLPDMLLRVSGLFIQRVSGAGHYTVARVRGSTGAQVNVYVDGVLMNLNGEAAVNLSTIPVDNVERIEVYRGYVPARFSGSPLGGVINIVTKKPQQASGRITQGVKSYGGYNATYEYNTPLGGGSLLATYQRDIWKGDYDFLGGRGQHSDGSGTGVTKRRSNGYQNDNGMLKWQDEHWMAKASWKQLHEELPVNVGGMTIEHSKPNAPIYDITGYDRYLSGSYDKEQDIDQKEFQLGRRDTVGKLDWGWRVAYLYNKKQFRNSGSMKDAYLSQWLPEDEFNADLGVGYYWGDYISKKWSGNLNAAYKLGDEHLLEANFDYSREKMDVDMDHIHAYDTGYDAAVGGRKYLRNYNINEYHFTLQDTIVLNDDGDFKLTPVFRADKVEMDTMSDNDKRWKYSGGAALQKQINDHWSFKTSWGTYNRHPNFYEIFGDGGNIRPNWGSGWGTANNYYDISTAGTWERGQQFDFSLNWQGRMAKADTDTVLTWFQRKADLQYILFMPMLPNYPSTYYPVSNVEVKGVELSHSMKWERLGLTLAGTWQKAEYSDTALNNLGAKQGVTMTPEWIFNVRLDYLFPGDKLSSFVEYNYTDEQSIDGGYQGGGQVDKTYSSWLTKLSTVDAGLKYVFDKHWKLDFGVNDIFNQGYKQGVRNDWSSMGIETGPYPLAGRMYYTTLEYRF